jgi:putative ABC transport system permease protein
MVDIDRTVLLFVAGVSLLTPVLFSLLPAFYAAGNSMNEALKEGRRATGTPGIRRGRAVLVVTQLALALMLLVVATLIVRTMAEVTAIDVGFNHKDLLTFRVDLPEWKYGTDESRRQFVDRVLPRLTSISGVQNAAATSRLPVLGGETTTVLTIEGQPVTSPKDRPWAARFATTPAYFATTGIPVLAGRVITDQDRPDAQPVAVINGVMATRYWKSAADAIGKRISLGLSEGQSSASSSEPAKWATIVGVVGNVLPADITLPPNPQLYVPFAQAPAKSLGFMIRSPQADTLGTTVRAVMREADREVAIYELKTVQYAFDDELSSSRILLGMYVAFALVALCLAAAGLYGVTSYSVTQRTQEIGIRMALGANPGDVRRLVLAQAVRFLVFGTVIGLVGAVVIANAMRKLLYQVSPVDAPTYFAVIAILTSVMLAAAFVPARRAMRVDPMIALRLD